MPTTTDEKKQDTAPKPSPAQDEKAQDPAPRPSYVQDNEEYDDVEEGEEDEEIDESLETGPRFNVAESFFLISFNLLGDILELFDLTGVGAVVGLIVDFVNGPFTVGYLFVKGVKKAVGKNAIAQAAELVPFLDLLPIRTVVITLTIMKTNHPEKYGWMDKLSPGKGKKIPKAG
jgi:hypothetical protein